MIPFYEPRLTRLHKAAVVKQALSGWIGPGKEVESFSADLARVVGRPCVVTGSGTQALMLTFWTLGLGRGATVVCPDYGLPACHNAARLAGCYVKIIDVDPVTGVMSPSALDKYLRAGGLCDAVVSVDHNGHFVQTREVATICRSRPIRIPLVEDAAVALGVAGAARVGDLAILSFSVPKIVTCGQGGAVLTDDPGFLSKLSELLDQGGGNWREERKHAAIGGNFRMTDLQAALGRAQLADIDDLIARRDRLWSWYGKEVDVEGPKPSGWVVTFRAKDKDHADRVIESCRAAGFDAKRLYQPVHRNGPYSSGGDDQTYPGAVTYWERTVYLPSSLTLTRDQVKKIGAAVRA